MKGANEEGTEERKWRNSPTPHRAMTQESTEDSEAYPEEDINQEQKAGQHDRN